MPKPELGRLLWRGVRKKCPVCGGGKLFASWFQMKPACPTCGFVFERESGYFLGAFVVNVAVTEFAVLVTLVLSVVLTLPDPPLILLALTMAAGIVVPLLTYPFSKTVWSAIDLAMHPLEGASRES